MNYFVEISEICNAIGEKFASTSSDLEKENYAGMMKDIHKRLEPLERQYKEERKFLDLMEKSSSTKLNRILAKVIVLRDEYITHKKVAIKQTRPEKSPEHIQFELFRNQRIRERKDGFNEVTGEKVTIKELLKCYKRWRDVSSQVRLLDMKQFEDKCEFAFGDSNGKKVYEHLRVFLEEEDVKEFDRLHQENTVI